MKREAAKVTGHIVTNTATQIAFWLFLPWWVAFTFSLISVVLVAGLIYAVVTLAFEQGRLAAALELQQHGAEAIYKAVIRQIVSNAPNN